MGKLPLASLCIFTYNQEDYIEEAIDGAFSQDYENLEIIISDDNSSDNTWQIIQKKVAQYDGKHKIEINRNIPNLGIAGHTNKLYYDLSKGDYVAIAAGDDISLPERVSKSVAYMIVNKDVNALSTGLTVIDKNSQVAARQRKRTEQDLIYDLEYYLSPEYAHINGPSRMVSRSLIDSFPPLHESCPTEDTPILLRAFLMGHVAQIKEQLVKYRVHDTNVSSPEGLKKMNLEAIFDQNFADLAFAKANSMLRKADYKRLQSRLEEIKALRISGSKRSLFQRIKSRLC